MNSVEDKIIIAAFELFVAQGFAATTIEQIAKHANVSKGLVYYYFRSKVQILKKIVEMIELPDSKLKEDLVLKMNLEELFNYFLKLNYEYYTTIKSICQQPWLQIQRFYFEALAILPDYYERIRQKYKMFLNLLQEKFEKNYQFDGEEAAMRAKFMFSVLEGLIYYLIFFPSEDITQFLKYSKEFFTAR